MLADKSKRGSEAPVSIVEREAEDLLTKGDIDLALSLLDHALETNVDESALWILRGISLTKRLRSHEAISSFFRGYLARLDAVSRLDRRNLRASLIHAEHTLIDMLMEEADRHRRAGEKGIAGNYDDEARKISKIFGLTIGDSREGVNTSGKRNGRASVC